MRIGVIGAGYVGLVTGTCLAEMGNTVTIVDIDPRKLEALRAGRSPHYEPGLDELLQRNIQSGRLGFDTAARAATAGAKAVFLAVGTPMAPDGSANMSYIDQAARDVVDALEGPCALIIKSTVPVGTNRRLTAMLAGRSQHEFDLVSNPEFLKEGAAVADFMKPDRVVVGVRGERAAALLRRVYAPFVRTGRPIMVTDPESAEMVKYASNALLASRISFMNEMAEICTRVGADIEHVRKGVGADGRIGSAFLFAGLGYGGSCFPKDVRALAHVAKELGASAPICEAVARVNERQRAVFEPALAAELGVDMTGRRVAIWGLAFKPRTDDVREAPALAVIEWLLERGATVSVYDPEAMETAREVLGERVEYAPDRDKALEGADALVIATEWNEFRSPDFAAMKTRMARPLIFDGRNLYGLETMAEEQFAYYSVGRPPVGATDAVGHGGGGAA